MNTVIDATHIFKGHREASLHEQLDSSINKFMQKTKDFHPMQNVAHLEEFETLGRLRMLHYYSCGCGKYD